MDFEGLFVNLEDYEKKPKAIGKGQFGTVYVVVERSTGKEYAAKIIKDKQIMTGNDQKMLLREVSILQQVSHPAILKFRGFNLHSFDSFTRPTIITDYIPRGSLAGILERESRGMIGEDSWTNTEKEIVLIGIAEAMKYLHENEIIHRDLKPSNILIDSAYHPYVSDFGLSKLIGNLSSSSKQKSMTNEIGTVTYMAPEILHGKTNYSQKVDVYSFGIMVYEIVTATVPYDELNFFSLIQQVINGKRPTIPNFVPKGMKRLIEECWSSEAEERPSFEDICAKLETDKNYELEGIEETTIKEYIEEIRKADTRKLFSQEQKDIIKKNDEGINNMRRENKMFKKEYSQVKTENELIIKEMKNQFTMLPNSNRILSRKIKEENERIIQENLLNIQEMKIQISSLERNIEKLNQKNLELIEINQKSRIEIYKKEKYEPQKVESHQNNVNFLFLLFLYVFRSFSIFSEVSQYFSKFLNIFHSFSITFYVPQYFSKFLNIFHSFSIFFIVSQYFSKFFNIFQSFSIFFEVSQYFS